MAGYWITLHDRPVGMGSAEAPGRGRGAAASASATLARHLGCRSCWWAPGPVAAWEAAFRALGLGAGHTVLHTVGPPTWLDRALDDAGVRRVELDMNPDTLEPAWPAPRDAVFVLDHRHAIPTLPPASALGARILEDATTALCGRVHGQPVGTLGHAAVLVLGTTLCPRSSGTVIATTHEGTSQALQREIDLTPLDDVADPALLVDLAAVADRVEAFQAAAAVYDSAWRGKDLDLVAIQAPPGTLSSRSEYMIGVRDPDGLAATLAQEGVETRRPLNPRLRRLLSDPSELLSGARTFYSRALQLPSHPGLDVGELLFVADVVVRHVRAAHE